MLRFLKKQRFRLYIDMCLGFIDYSGFKKIKFKNTYFAIKRYYRILKVQKSHKCSYFFLNIQIPLYLKS